MLFPTTGAHATVTAVLRDGRRVVLEPGANLALADVAWLRLAGDDGGYVVVVRSRALPGTLRLLRARPQSSAPRAGPTAGFALLSGGPLRELSACVRIAPARTTAEAQRVAAALGARA